MGGGLLSIRDDKGGFKTRPYRGFVDLMAEETDNLLSKERLMENELKKVDIDKLPLPKLVEALRLAAKSCQCEGTREAVFTARGRDNVVNCLACEPVHDALDLLEKALKILQPGR
jgi:hypothetical protein